MRYLLATAAKIRHRRYDSFNPPGPYFRGRPLARDALTGSEQDARRTLVDLRAAGVDLEEVADLLLRQGIEAFAMAMGGLLDSIQRRRA